MPSALERCFSYCATSAPETKALSPSPFSTTTRTSGSCSKRSSAFGIASHMSIETAFLRAVLLNVSQPIGPCFSATMRSPSAPVARAGCLRRARSSSWVMSLVFEAKTAIVSRAAPARQRKNRLSEKLGELRPDDSIEDVVRAARGRSDDEPDRLAREKARERGLRQREAEKAQRTAGGAHAQAAALNKVSRQT